MDNMNPDDASERMMMSSKLRSPNQLGDTNTMGSFQDGGQQTMNTEQSEFSQPVDMSLMNQEMNSYGSSSGDQPMVPDSYGRMGESVHPSQMQAYNSYNRGNYMGDPTQHGGLAMGGSGEFANQTNPFHGQYSQSNYRPNFPGGPKPGMTSIRPGMGMMHSGYHPQQRFMSAQSMAHQGSTPTLNQLLQTPNSSPRFQQNSYGDYGGVSPKGSGEIPSGNSPYGVQQNWSTNPRSMNAYPPQGVPSSPFRNQVSFLVVFLYFWLHM